MHSACNTLKRNLNTAPERAPTHALMQGARFLRARRLNRIHDRALVLHRKQPRHGDWCANAARAARRVVRDGGGCKGGVRGLLVRLRDRPTVAAPLRHCRRLHDRAAVLHVLRGAPQDDSVRGGMRRHLLEPLGEVGGGTRGLCGRGPRRGLQHGRFWRRRNGAKPTRPGPPLRSARALPRRRRARRWFRTPLETSKPHSHHWH